MTIPTYRALVCRRAFTLVELLSVIAIIGMLITLLLPALNAGRETARRSHCHNNLRQLGLAAINLEVAHQHLPSGGWDWDMPPTYVGGVPAQGAEQRAGWGFQLLPFMEAEAIWRAGAVQAIGTPQPIFFCPSRREPQTTIVPDQYKPPLTGSPLIHALCDYAASNRGGDGAIRRFKPLRLKQLRGEVSRTLLFADKRLNLARLGQPQDDDNEGYTAGWNSDTIRRTDKPPRPDYAGEGDGDELFGGSHPGAIQSVFVDGAVHAISFGVEARVFLALGSVERGQVMATP